MIILIKHIYQVSEGWFSKELVALKNILSQEKKKKKKALKNILNSWILSKMLTRMKNIRTFEDALTTELL